MPLLSSTLQALEAMPKLYKPIFESYAALLGEDRHASASIGSRALGVLKSKLKLDTIEEVDLEKLKSALSPLWPNYDDFILGSSRTKLYLVLISFKKLGKANWLVKKKDGAWPMLFKALESTSRESLIAGGLVVPIANSQYVICIDADASGKDTILLHEFIHYVQLATGKLKTDVFKNLELTPKIREQFGVSAEAERYVFDEHEFWANVYVSFFAQLQKAYWLGKFNKDYSWPTFVHLMMDDLEESRMSLESSHLAKLWTRLCLGDKFFLGLLACLSYIKPSLYKELSKRLEDVQDL